MEIMRSASVIQDWIKEAEVSAEERGKELGKELGEVQSARTNLTDLLEARFGLVPQRVRDRIQDAGTSWCRERIRQAACAQSLDEIDWR